VGKVDIIILIVGVAMVIGISMLSKKGGRNG
jgi:hypothetical protein